MQRVYAVRAAKWLGVAYAAAVALVLFGAADAPDVLLMDLIFIPWIAGPAAVAALCSKASETRRGALVFLTLEAAVVASTVLAWIYLILIAPDPQNGVAMGVFLPLYQFGAVIVFFSAAYLFGWRARPEWLDS